MAKPRLEQFEQALEHLGIRPVDDEPVRRGWFGFKTIGLAAVFALGFMYGSDNSFVKGIPEKLGSSYNFVMGIDEASPSYQIGKLREALRESHDSMNSRHVIQASNLADHTEAFYDSLKRSGFSVDQGIALIDYLDRNTERGTDFFDISNRGMWYINQMGRRGKTMEEGIDALRGAVEAYSDDLSPRQLVEASVRFLE